MSGDGASIRQSEPATLVVGDADLAERVRSAVEGPVVPVEDYLAALGEMAHRPVSAVVGDPEPMGVSVDATVRGLRELGPSARLVLVVDAEHEPRAMRAVRLGFDDYLIRPVSPEELREMLAGRAVAAEGGAAGPADPGLAVPFDGGVFDGAGGGDRFGAGGAMAEDGASGLVRDGGAAGLPFEPLNGAPEGEAGRLTRGASGDEAELVDQLMRGQHDLREAAVETVRRRLGAPDVRWSDGPAGEAAASVPVSYERALLGYLAAETISVERLADEAAWLGRWVAVGRHIGALTEMAFRDELTGLRNRRYFDRFLRLVLERARAERFHVTLMVYDIDDFKTYNDRFGHEAGDEILRETARLMGSVVRRHDVVARIGGDEFAVIFWDAEPPRRENSAHPDSVRSAAERFQRSVCEHRFPKLAERAPGTLTISGGLASYPWDGQQAEQLLHAADHMLLESKRQGKNAITFGPGAVRACGVSRSLAEWPGEA